MLSRMRRKKPRRRSSRSGSEGGGAAACAPSSNRSYQSRAIRSRRRISSWSMSALGEARESLTYWETRLETLPLRAVRKRREAREMAARWRDRVCEAERLQYGAGLLGAALMIFAERRLPTETRYTSRSVTRIASRAALAAFALLAVVVGIPGAAALRLRGGSLPPPLTSVARPERGASRRRPRAPGET